MLPLDSLWTTQSKSASWPCSTPSRSAKPCAELTPDSRQPGGTGSFSHQPDKPERAILADPDAWYGGDQERMGHENYADYQQAIHDPATVTAMLEDYRAGLGVDRAADDADRAAGRQISCPTMVLWSSWR